MQYFDSFFSDVNHGDTYDQLLELDNPSDEVLKSIESRDER